MVFAALSMRLAARIARPTFSPPNRVRFAQAAFIVVRDEKADTYALPLITAGHTLHSWRISQTSGRETSSTSGIAHPA